MRRIITALVVASAALVAFANDSPDYSGFASFGWGSDYEFVKTEQLNEGYEPFVDDGEWLWYRGSMLGCDTEFGYSFEYGVLYDGMMLIDLNESRCWSDLIREFRNIYTQDNIETATSGRPVFRARDTHISAWIPREGKHFIVSYYWRPDDE